MTERLYVHLDCRVEAFSQNAAFVYLPLLNWMARVPLTEILEGSDPRIGSSLTVTKECREKVMEDAHAGRRSRNQTGRRRRG